MQSKEGVGSKFYFTINAENIDTVNVEQIKLKMGVIQEDVDEEDIQSTSSK